MEDFFRESGVKWLWERIKTLLSAKQDKLVSGTNIKTINGTSLLGSGDVSIEGGGDFDSSGTYPNLTAGKATKLATARTISLSGGASGSVSFDGSKDVSIPTNNIYQGNIVWGGRNNIGELSPLEATNPFFSADRFAFGSSDAVTVEYSNDGGVTWLDYGANNGDKAKLFLSQISQSGAFYVGNKTGSVTTDDMLRITIDGSLLPVCCRLNCILLKVAKISGTTDAICDIEYTFNNGSVGSKKNNYIQGWPAWNGISFAQYIPFGASEANAVTKVIKLTVKVTKNLTNSPCLQNVMGIANVCYDTYPSILAKYGTVYMVDGFQNAIFPAIIKPQNSNSQDIGTSHFYWRNIYGNKFITKRGTNQQVVLGDGSLRPISELSPITDADADILLDNHIHSINVNANGNNVNISVIESSKNGDTWETEDNDIPIPLATPTSAGVMSKEDKAKLDGNISVEPDSGMPDFIGDFEYSDVDYEAIIDLTTVDWINWVEGGLFMMNAEETWEEDNGDTSYHQCVVTFIYRSNGCIPISIVNTNKMTAKMSGMVITINLTEGTGELRFKQIKLI